MRPLILLLLLTASLLLSSCASSDPDSAFFTRGWLNPKELDEPDPPVSAPPTL